MSKRSSYGSITRIDSGTYRIRWWGDSHDGKGYRRMSKTIRGSRRDATKFLAEQRLAHDYAAPVPTVREVFDRWYWPDVESRLSANTQKQYISTWRKHIEPRWADVAVTGVKPIAIQEWLDGMTVGAAGMSMRVLSPILEYAVRYEFLDSNPCRVRYRMPTQGYEHDKGVWSLSELAVMADALRGKSIEAAFLLSAFGSCRVGEAVAVTREDIEVVTASNGMRCAVVSIGKQRDASGGTTESLKTEQSNRIVVIPAPWGDRLMELAGRRQRDGHAYMLEGSSGNPVSSSTLSAIWKSELDGIGIEHHPFRNLRNSWRTSWEYEAGVPSDTLEILMGHVGKTVSAKYYTRPSKEMLVDTVANAFEHTKIPK